MKSLSGSASDAALPEWSLDQELCNFAGTQSLLDAIRHLGLGPQGVATDDLNVSILKPWHRSGAETYCLHFRVHDHEHMAAWVLKACIASPVTGTLADTVRDWLERRSLLSRFGVSTPKLIGVHNATILEEFIPSAWQDALTLATPERHALLVSSAARSMGVISELGFPAVDVVTGLMSRGSDSVVVDFGQDLGPAGVAQPGTSVDLDQLLHRLEQLHFEQSSAMRRELVSAFESGERTVRRRTHDPATGDEDDI